MTSPVYHGRITDISRKCTEITETTERSRKMYGCQEVRDYGIHGSHGAFTEDVRNHGIHGVFTEVTEHVRRSFLS